jgi:hypothetical protein
VDLGENGGCSDLELLGGLLLGVGYLVLAPTLRFFLFLFSLLPILLCLFILVLLIAPPLILALVPALVFSSRSPADFLPLYPSLFPS